MLCSAGLGAGGWGSECVECLGTRPRTTQGTAASRQAHPCSGAGRPCPAGPTHARGVWGLPPERGRPHGRMIQGDSTCGEQRNFLGRFSCGVWFSQSRRSQKFPGNFHRHRGTHRRCGSQPGRSVPGTPPPSAAAGRKPPSAPGGGTGLRRPPWVSVIAPRLHVACVLWILVCDLDFPPARFFSIPNREAEPGIVFAGSGQGEVTSCGVRGPGRGRGSAVACALS